MFSVNIFITNKQSLNPKFYWCAHRDPEEKAVWSHPCWWAAKSKSKGGFLVPAQETFPWSSSSSFRIWNSSTGIPSPPLALFVAMVPNAHLTSYSRMAGSRWVITPSWLSGSWRTFLYCYSVFSCHLFLISFASLKSIPFLSFIVPFRVVSSAYLRLLVLLLGILTPACDSSSPAFHVMFSEYKLNF